MSGAANAQNQPPYAHPQVLFVKTNTPTTILLTGDDDADYVGSATNYHFSPNPGDIPALSFALLSSPTNGFLSGTAPNLVYTPTNLTGRDYFTFKVNDGSLDSTNLAAVSILITNRVGAVRRWDQGTTAIPITGGRNDDGAQLWSFAAGSTNSDRLNRSVLFKIGTPYNQFYVNNNGNISFGSAYSNYVSGAFPIAGAPPMIAPLMADVDTTAPASGVAMLSKGFVNGRVATAITWPSVGYYSARIDKSNTFQVVLIDRSDLSPGDMEVEFNYNEIQWFAGTASVGTYPSVGWQTSSSDYFNTPGTLTPSVTNLITTSTGSSVPGRHVYRFTSGTVASWSNIDISPVSNTHARFSGTVVARLFGTVATLQYGTNSNNLSSSVVLTNIPYGVSATNQVVTVLSNLTVGTTYYYRLMSAGEQGTFSSPTNFFTMSQFPPAVNTISPANGPTSGGTLVTLTGTNFTTNAFVLFGVGTPPTITSRSETELQFSTRAGQGVNQPVTVWDGPMTSNSKLFSYDPPVITSVAPTNVLTSGGTFVTLTGNNFGTNGTVLFNGNPCTINSYSHTHIQFVVPSGQGTGHTVSVSVGGQTSNTKFIGYQPASIFSVSPASGPTAGGTTITINGNNFGTNNSLTLDGRPCTITSRSHTSISFTLPLGQGANLPLALTVSGETTTLPNAFSYNAPQISAHSPTNGPSSGGTTVILSGTDFGTSPVVTLDGKNCPIVSSNHTQISFVTMPGEGINRAIQVNAAGQLSTIRFFSYDPPSIAMITPTNGPTSGGTLVTLVGSSLGTNGTVLFNGVPCITTNRTHSQLQFFTPPGQGVSNAVSVTVAGQASLNTRNFRYDSPSIASFSPTSASTAGDTVMTLLGSNFGTNGTVLIDGNACVINSYTHTQIQCVVPAGQGTNHTLGVVVAGQASTLKTFSYLQPSILSVNPSTGPTAGGTAVTLSGINFGLTPTVTMAGTACAVTSSSHSHVTFVTPVGQGVNHPIQVTVAGQTSNVGLFSYEAPVLAFMAPANGPTVGGIVAVLAGSNFGTNATVLFNGIPCAKVPPSTHTTIKFAVPPGEGVTNVVQLNVGGQLSGTQTFAYDSPVLQSYLATNAPTQGGTMITLTGLNFGTNATVLFNGNPCVVTINSHTYIQFVLPPGEGIANTITVSAAGQTSIPLNFAYNAPASFWISPNPGPTAGGIIVTNRGTNFGTNATLTFNGNPVEILARNHTNIEFRLPAGQGYNIPVMVTASGQSTPIVMFSYAAPIITSLSTTNGPEAGGTLITLVGNNFGTIGSVTVDGNPCLITSYSNTEISCLTPAGIGTNRLVIVTVSGQTSNAKPFNYLSDPRINTHPADQTAFLKGSAAFSVVATGTNQLRYQWQKVDGLNVTDLFRATNATLVFPSVGTNHAGVYRVQVTSGGNSVFSDTATLSILDSGSLKSAAGQYTGLFFETNQLSHRSSGYVQVKLTTNAVCSGKLLIDGDSVPFTAKVNTSGATSKEISRVKWAKSPITISLSFDLTNGTDVVTGSVVSSNLWSAELTADRNVFSKTNSAAAFAADYALLFSSETRGEGIGRGLVKTNGTIAMTMHMRDGFKTKQGSFVSKNGQVPMYALMYPGVDVITNGAVLKTNRNYKGSLFGWILLETNGPTGAAAWIRTGSGGFTNELSVDGWR